MRGIDHFLKLLEGDGVVCMSCGRRTEDIALSADGVGLCKRCYGRLMKIKTSDYYDVGGDILRLFAPFRYEDNIKRMIYKMKFCGERAYAPALAKLIFDTLPPYYDFSCFDMIIPVPLHKTRLEMRGFNQAELMAEELSRNLKIPMVADALVRNRATARQMRLSRNMRMTNVKDAFTATGAVAGKDILLVDDIYTVGATVSECTKALKKQDAGRVNVIVLCTNFQHRHFERPPTIPALKRKKNATKG